jgi:hypothetical protein
LKIRPEWLEIPVGKGYIETVFHLQGNCELKNVTLKCNTGQAKKSDRL